MRDRRTAATRERFGYGWFRSTPATSPPLPYHLHAMRCALEAQPFEGRVLDAGSGEGVDLAWVALNDGCRAFGVELSEGGLFATRARIDCLAHPHVVQGDVL